MMKREEAALRCKTNERPDQQAGASTKPVPPQDTRQASDARYIESRLKQFSLR